MAKEPAKIGAKVVVDGEKEYKSAIADINKSMAVLASEARKTAAAYSDNKDSLEALQAQTDGYKNQAEEQRKKVEVLSEAYENSKKKLGENANATKEWLIKLNNAEAALFKTEKAIESNEDALKKQSTAVEKIKNKFKEWEDSIDDLKEKHPVLTKAVEGTAGAAQKLASGGLKAIGVAAKGTATAFTGLVAGSIGVANELLNISEETKELRKNLGVLETAFTTNNLSAEQSKDSYVELYSVLGDSDKASETALHISAIADSEKELSEWANICTGVYGRFANTLPTEALAEAANETSKTGKITGALADALNWAGENEEKFQAKLDACSTEQERQTLITKTLNELYGESAEKYREINETLITAQKAQANYSLSLTELGGAVDEIKNEAMAEFLPGITEIIDGLTALFSGEEGAATLIENGVNDIAEGIKNFTPIIKDIFESFTEIIRELTPEIITTLVTGIADNLEPIFDAAFIMLDELAKGLLDEGNIQKIVIAALDIVTGLVGFLGDNADLLVNSAFTMVDALIDGLLGDENAEKLFESALDIVMAIVTGIIENAPEIIVGAAELVGVLAYEIIHYDWWQVAKDIFNGIVGGMKTLVTGGSDGSHAGGLDYVPYDGYRAVLHKGEKLLTASEAVAYDRNQVSSSNNDELNRKLDMLLSKGQAPVNVNLVAKGSNAAVVRALNIQVEREEKRASAFG